MGALDAQQRHRVSMTALVVVIALAALAARGSQAHTRAHPKSLLRIEALAWQLDGNVSITTNVTQFTKQGEHVLVRWEGVRSPNRTDFIALFAPANATQWHKLPVHYASCAAADGGYLSTGAGSAVFKLINLRTTYRFALLRGGVVRPTLVAQSEPIWNHVTAHPTAVHLALHRDQRSVVVQWVSGFSAPQQAQWALLDATHHPANHTWRFIASSEAVTYNASHMCGYPANSTGYLHPGYLHSALLPARDLQPGQRYLYRVGMENVGWSDAYSFIAPIGPGVAALRHAGRALPTPLALPAPSSRGARTASLVAPASVDTPAASGGAALPGHMASSSRRSLAQQQQQQQQEEDGAGERLAGSGGRARGGGGGAKEEEAPLKFLAFNDVAMTDPMLFYDPGRGLSFSDHYGENSTWLSAWLGEQGRDSDAHLALLVGDLAYAMGYASDWDVWFDQFQQAFSRWPLMVGTGNHERDFKGTGDAFGDTARDSGGECNVPFTYRFYLPTDAPQPNPRVSYYSFDQGPVHFVILDSETPSDPASPQGQFVARDLAAVDRSVTPWVVVGLHRMMVAPATWRSKWVGDVDVEERLQRDYEDLFLRHQVDVVIQGHEHAYARSCPYFKAQCADAASKPGNGAAPLQPSNDTCRTRDLLDWLLTPKCWLRWLLGPHDEEQLLQRREEEAGAERAAVHLPGKPRAVSGATRHLYQAPAGGPVYVLAGHAGAGFTHGFPDELPGWAEVAIQDQNGYLRFEVTSTRLRMEAVSSQDGALMDHFELLRT